VVYKILRKGEEVQVAGEGGSRKEEKGTWWQGTHGGSSRRGAWQAEAGR